MCDALADSECALDIMTGMREDMDAKNAALIAELDAAKARVARMEEGLAWMAECVIRERGGTPDPDGWIARSFEMADARNAELEALRAMAHFGGIVLDDLLEYPGDDIDGGCTEDTAEVLDLLKRTRMDEPCEEDCACAESGARFPLDCLRITPEARRIVGEALKAVRERAK